MNYLTTFLQGILLIMQKNESLTNFMNYDFDYHEGRVGYMNLFYL